MKEEKCIILDFLPTGYSDRRQAEPIAQAIGCDYFSLLEVVPREGVSLKALEEAYIGEGKRDTIRFIRGQIHYDNLTNMARNELPEIIEKIVKENEKKYVEFFNKGKIITPRLHQFQLLPGVGKKHLLDMLDERAKKPFESFADIAQRVKMFPDPMKTVIRRIMLEIEGNEKYFLFVAPQKRTMF